MKSADQIASEIRRYKTLAEIPTTELVSWADDLGNSLVKGLKTAQIRRFLSAVMEIQVKLKTSKSSDKGYSNNEAQYLKVYLAYAKGRQAGVEPLLTVMLPIIDRVGDGDRYPKDFKILSKFVQAVVAYHRYWGGK